MDAQVLPQFIHHLGHGIEKIGMGHRYVVLGLSLLLTRPRGIYPSI